MSTLESATMMASPKIGAATMAAMKRSGRGSTPSWGLCAWKAIQVLCQGGDGLERRQKFLAKIAEGEKNDAVLLQACSRVGVQQSQDDLDGRGI